MGAYQTVILQVEQDSDDDHPENWDWREVLDEHGGFSQEDQGTVYATQDPAVVVYGNPVDGFQCKVAYNDHEARRWAENNLSGDWWIIETEEMINP